MSLSDSNHSTTSNSLVLRLRRQDLGAWQQMVDLYGPLIIAWCRRRGLNKQDGADVLQNVFLSVAKGLGSWQPRLGQEGSFRRWLWTITKHRIIDFQRAKPEVAGIGGSSNLKQLHEAVDEFGQIDPDQAELEDDEPSEAVDIAQLMQRAAQQVERNVAAKTWQAFWRTAIDGIATDAVAAELQMSVPSVRQARCRVLRHLREQLGDC